MRKYTLTLAAVIGIFGFAVVSLHCANWLFPGRTHRMVYFAFPRPAIRVPQGGKAIHNWTVKPGGCELGLTEWSVANAPGVKEGWTDVSLGPLILRFHSLLGAVGIYFLLLLGVMIAACTWMFRRKPQHA